MRLVSLLDSFTEILRLVQSDSAVPCASPALVSCAILLYHFSTLLIATDTADSRYQDEGFALLAGLGIARSRTLVTVLMDLGVFLRSHASDRE